MYVEQTGLSQIVGAVVTMTDVFKLVFSFLGAQFCKMQYVRICFHNGGDTQYTQDSLSVRCRSEAV